MRELTSDSPYEVIAKCEHFPFLKIGIAFNTLLSMGRYLHEHFFNWREQGGYELLYNTGDAMPHVQICGHRIRGSAPNYYIEFDNGSIIKTFIASDRARGNKFNEIYVDPAIASNIREEILSPMEITRESVVDPHTGEWYTGWHTIPHIDPWETTVTINRNECPIGGEYGTYVNLIDEDLRRLAEIPVTIPKPQYEPELEYTISKEEFEKFLEVNNETV